MNYKEFEERKKLIMKEKDQEHFARDMQQLVREYVGNDRLRLLALRAECNYKLNSEMPNRVDSVIAMVLSVCALLVPFFSLIFQMDTFCNGFKCAVCIVFAAFVIAYIVVVIKFASFVLKRNNNLYVAYTILEILNQHETEFDSRCAPQ